MFHNIKDVGFLQVKVIRAEALMAADVTGKDSFSLCDSKYQGKLGVFQSGKKMFKREVYLKIIACLCSLTFCLLRKKSTDKQTKLWWQGSRTFNASRA